MARAASPITASAAACRGRRPPPPGRGDRRPGSRPTRLSGHPRHRRRRLHRLPRRPGAARPRRRGRRLRRRQRLLRPRAQGGAPRRARRPRPAPARLRLRARRPRRPRRGRRRLRRARPLRPGDPPRRPGRRPLQPRKPASPTCSPTSSASPTSSRPAATPAVAHLTYASTSSVYGANTTMPFSESAGRRPSAAVLCRDQARERADGARLQPPLPAADHGPALLHRLRPLGPAGHGAVHVHRGILAGRPIQLFNHGQHSRDFTYVDDIVEGVIRACDRPAAPGPRLGPDAPDPATSRRAVPHLQHRQQRPGPARRLHRGARGGAGPEAPARAAAAAARRRARHLRRQLRACAAVGWRPATPVARGCGASSTGTATITAEAGPRGTARGLIGSRRFPSGEGAPPGLPYIPPDPSSRGLRP